VKALLTGLAALAVEATQIIVAESRIDAMLQAVGIRAGQLFVLFIVLGLWYEWRLASVARVPWGRLRDFRSLRELTAPALAVLIAIATAIATGFAGAAVSALLQRPADESPLGPAPPSVSPSAPPTGGP